MTAQRSKIEIDRDPIVYFGERYSVGEFFEQLLALEVRNYWGGITKEWVSHNVEWAETLLPGDEIVWEQDETGVICPRAVAQKI
jgi:hypothetical protein